MTVVMDPHLLHRMRDELRALQGGVGLVADQVHPPDCGPLTGEAVAAVDALVAWVRGYAELLGDLASGLDLVVGALDSADGRADVLLDTITAEVLS